MKSPIAFAIVTISIGIISQGFADPSPVSGGPSSGGIGLPGTNTGTGSTGASSAATPNENNTDENDDALYRGKTGESENPMLRDEGALHFKKHPKEKIQEVESLKNLQSSKPDPKFQGSLLNSDVSSIEKVSEKANETRDAADEKDPRFKTKRLNFTPAKTDEPKKAQSDSSPSPTPSPTASPAAKNSGKSKE
jgi:hypothetical protein